MYHNEKDGINLDYDYNTEYGDGDIPEPDKSGISDSPNSISQKTPSRKKRK